MSDIAKSLEKMLNESPVEFLDIQELVEKDKALNELNKLCERKVAYRLGVDKFVGRQFLWNLILDNIKVGNSLAQLQTDRHFVSQHIISKMLESMEREGLIEKEDGKYYVVLDKVLSREVILEFCHQRADQITTESILAHFRFNSNVTACGATGPSKAFYHCQQIVDKLCNEGVLKRSNMDNSFSWGDI